MIIDYVGVKEINGSLIVIDGVKDAFFDEVVDISGNTFHFPYQYPYTTDRSPYGNAYVP